MPTNPLWVQHTERAAWDTVSALRAEIDKANHEIEQLREALREVTRERDELKLKLERLER